MPWQRTCDLVELLIELGQLGALPHDVLPHEEGGHDGHGAPLIAGVQGILDQGLVQQHAFVAQVEAPPTCIICFGQRSAQSVVLCAVHALFWASGSIRILDSPNTSKVS